MEDVYINVRPSKNQTGLKSSQRRFHGAVVFSLGLLSVFLLAALIGLCVTYYDFMQSSAAELSTVKANLTKQLQTNDDTFSSLTEERDLLNASLTEVTKEVNRLKHTCPEGWTMFSCACYFLSTESASWENGREDCRDRGADLVVISTSKEQLFLTNLTKEETPAWIGLTDRFREGTWIWIDGSLISLKYWQKAQPDNGGGRRTLEEEDCARIISGGTDIKNWSDVSCKTSLRWICQKTL